jgi:hypothetical protein
VQSEWQRRLAFKKNQIQKIISSPFISSRAERKAGGGKSEEERGRVVLFFDWGLLTVIQCSFVTDRGRGRGRGRVQKTEWWLVTNIATGQAQSTI